VNTATAYVGERFDSSVGVGVDLDGHVRRGGHRSGALAARWQLFGKRSASAP
jgi:hypothetical protein